MGVFGLQCQTIRDTQSQPGSPGSRGASSRPWLEAQVGSPWSAQAVPLAPAARAALWAGSTLSEALRPLRGRRTSESGLLRRDPFNSGQYDSTLEVLGVFGLQVWTAIDRRESNRRPEAPAEAPSDRNFRGDRCLTGKLHFPEPKNKLPASIFILAPRIDP